jgi:GNAT superfamily N-acetyltransferase
MTEPRVATSAADGDRVVEILVGSFYSDPTWSWAFPDPGRRREQHALFWRAFVDGAMRYPWVWLDAEAAATSVWIPPGGSELSQEQEAAMTPLVQHLLGDDADRVLQAFDLFDENHPQQEPHYYLSLLGTDPAFRGRGLGLALLAANLSVIDAEGAPAYLEASNPANVALYERYGFTTVGRFTLPDDGPTVHTMWRAAAGS